MAAKRSGRWMVEFVRVRVSVLIALFGVLLGLTVHQPARTAVWIVTGLLVMWFYIGNVARQKRYERMRTQLGSGDRVATQTSREQLRLMMLRDQARWFANWAIVGACIAAAGIAVSFSYSAAIRVGIIVGSVVCGGWLALVGLTLRKRVRAGPMAHLATHSQPPGTASVVEGETPGDTDGT